MPIGYGSFPPPRFYIPAVAFIAVSVALTPGSGELRIDRPVREPLRATVSLSSDPPTVAQGAPISPAAGQLATAAGASTLALGLPGAAGGLILSTGPPRLDLAVSTSVGALATAGGAGRNDLGLPTPVGAAILAGVAPTIQTGGGSPSLTPAGASLSASGASPPQDLGDFSSAGALALTASAPSLLRATLLTASAGSLSTAGAAPSELTDFRPGASAGVVALVGIAPTVQGPTGAAMTPLAGAATLAGGQVGISGVQRQP